jgi:uncharacterized protein YwgA
VLNRNVILLALHAFGGEISGRTLLVKRLFFLGELLRRDMSYYPHYYGPYSDAITDDLGLLRNLGMIDEKSNEFNVSHSGFEVRRYDYRLTKEGEKAVSWLEAEYAAEVEAIRQQVSRLKDAGDPNYIELSVAAKAYMIVKQAKRPLTPQAISREARKFSWHVTDKQVESAVEFLKKLKLVAVTRN